jgi:AraC family transcriptional activator of pobA
MKKASVPLYGIERFKKKVDNRDQYQVEVFVKNRNFNVVYPHRHDFYEILLITKGSGTHTIDFQTFEIKPTCVFFLSPGQIHSLDLSDDIDGFVFLFTSEFYLLNKQDKNKLLELPFFYSLNNEHRPLYLEGEDNSLLLTDLFRRACIEYQQSSADAEEMVRSLMDIVLLLCKRLYPSSLPEGNKKSGRLLVKKFKQLIEEKYQEGGSVKDYATILAVTPNHLNETVKNSTGRTASALISDKTVLEMKRLLLHTELSVSEIAQQLNFVDPSYFSKYFRKNLNMSPNDFRKAAIKNT